MKARLLQFPARHVRQEQVLLQDAAWYRSDDRLRLIADVTVEGLRDEQWRLPPRMMMFVISHSDWLQTTRLEKEKCPAFLIDHVVWLITKPAIYHVGDDAHELASFLERNSLTFIYRKRLKEVIMDTGDTDDQRR